MEASHDETYRAAKAAAAEAQTRTAKSPTPSLFGKLFRRGPGGNGAEERQPQQSAWRLPEDKREGRRPPPEGPYLRPQERMQGMLARLAEAARTSTDAVTQLRKRRATTAEEMAVAAQAARLAGRNTEIAEHQQSEAVDREDFEAAARCGDAAERHRTEEGEHTEACQRLRAAVAALDDEVDAASATVAARFARAHAELSALEDEVRRHGEGVREGFVGATQRLRDDTARLEQERTLIEADAQAWEEASAEVQGRIGEDTNDLEEECTGASSELEEVNKTIIELQEQLAAAESRASELISTVSSCHRSIQAIRSKHAKQLGRVEKEEQAMKVRRVDWVSKKVSAETARAAHDAAVAAHTEDMLRREEIIKEIQAESATARDCVDIVANAFVEVNPEDDIEDGDDGNLGIEVSIHKAAVAEAQGVVTAAEATLRDLQKELAAIDVHLPVLGAEKKMATTKRDFKEAGRASKEIKEAAMRKQQLGELAGEATKRHQRAHAELQSTAALLAEAQARAAEKSEEAEQKRLDVLRQKIDALRALSQQVPTASSENFAEKFVSEHWDGGEGAITVACVGACVLVSQIHLLQEGGTELGERYGGGDWTEYDVAEDESVQSAPSFDSANKEDGDGEANTDSPIVIDEAVLARYNHMRSQMKQLGEAIDAAVKEEDFDKAAELEEQLKNVLDELERSGLLSEKYTRAMKEFGEAATSSASAAVDNSDSSEDVVDGSVLKNGSSHYADVKEIETSIEGTAANKHMNEEAVPKEKVPGARSNGGVLGCSKEELEEAPERVLAAETILEEDERGEQFFDALDNGGRSKEESTDGL